MLPSCRDSIQADAPARRGRPHAGVQTVVLAMILALLMVGVLVTGQALGAGLQIANAPLYGTRAVKPLVMINLSRDHQLHFKAYNDYSDLRDGRTRHATPATRLESIQTTYTNSIEYYGYFDGKKCYRYVVAAGAQDSRFEPVALANNHYCNDAWSGNFLNWVSMSRLDVVRKLLYGGKRVTDTATDTVLERSFLPMDAHAWAKYYNGDDLARLTPFADVQSAPSPVLRSGTLLGFNEGLKTVTTDGRPTNYEVGDQVRLQARGAGSEKFMIGWIAAKSGNNLTLAVYRNGISAPAGSGTHASWEVSNLSQTGLTFCNVTPADTSARSTYSQANGAAPQIRVVRGNYALWTSSERWQCNWAEDKKNTQKEFLTRLGRERDGVVGAEREDVFGSSNGNLALLSSMYASAENPPRERRVQTSPGLPVAGEFIARVRVCVAGLIGDEKCKQYANGTFKPIGLLQTYGDSDSNLMNFGLMTGSYQKNISGGVLRRNVGDFSAEVSSADGTFTAVKGIVFNLDQLRIYGYDYGEGTYDSANADGCGHQLTGIVAGGGSNSAGRAVNEGSCSNWGNPLSEIYLETLRYFAGKGGGNASYKGQEAYHYAANSKDAALRLTVENWVDPLNTTNYCSSLNTLVFNASVSSHDGDQLGLFSELGSADTAAVLTGRIGDYENITGQARFIGSDGSRNDGLCSAKIIDTLGLVSGLCPEAPSQQGTYNIAGMAWYAHRYPIRKAPDAVALAVPALDKQALKVTTYGVQLATNTPKINIDVGGRSVTLLPAYRVNAGGLDRVYSPGSLVDFKIISRDESSGSFYVSWEASAQGGDFDQDMWGILSYRVREEGKLDVTTVVVGVSAQNAQGFGYVIAGTDRDGPHFHSGDKGFNFGTECRGCSYTDPPSTMTYTVTGSTAALLQDPLYYAAKWGGFTDLNGNGIADDVAEWDARLAEGQSEPDGLPDNYFFVTNPGDLERALQRTFAGILAAGSSAAVASSSTSLHEGTHIYQARFNGSDWSGQLLDYAIAVNGALGTAANWDAGKVLNTLPAARRTILSWNDDPASVIAGIPFAWNALPAKYKSSLDTDARGRTDTLGEQRLEWLRGERRNEGTASGRFRVRNLSVLGDIVNSSPQYVGMPADGHADSDYAAFAQQWANRPAMLYVGANDGMLHGFSAADGSEKLAYIPSSLIPHLSKLPDPGYTHRYYVDGTPVIRDVKVNSAWKTMLVGTLGAGGRAVFALDVTNPDRFTQDAAGALVAWEFDDRIDADLGYTIGRPSIVKMANGRWAAVFGNGYNSTATGKAWLFILFLDREPGRKTWVEGVDYLKLPTSTAGSAVGGTPATPNGLSQPAAADVDGDGVIDYVYAGDLLGNLWKFNVKGGDASAWGLAWGVNRPLFTAKNHNQAAQPITAAPDVLRHPNGGYVVLFGTGRYVQIADVTDLSVQTLYGIRDEDGNQAPSPLIDRAQLTEQNIVTEREVTGSRYRVTSNNTSASSAKGWYMDLKVSGAVNQSGERVVYAPMVRNGRVIFTTIIPSSMVCEDGTGWLMEVDALTGRRLLESPFDVNRDRLFTEADWITLSEPGATPGAEQQVAVTGLRSGVGIPSVPTILETGKPHEIKVISGSTGKVESVFENAPGAGRRLSWREILQ